MKQSLDYETPRPPDRGAPARFLTLIPASSIAGIATAASLLIGGFVLAILVAPCAGILLSAVAAGALHGQEFRAGVVASGFAAASACVSVVVFVAISEPDALPVAFAAAALSFIVLWLLFAVPGLLGSLLVSECRRPRSWNQMYREK